MLKPINYYKIIKTTITGGKKEEIQAGNSTNHVYRGKGGASPLALRHVPKNSLKSLNPHGNSIRYKADKKRYYTLILAKRPRSELRQHD